MLTHPPASRVKPTFPGWFVSRTFPYSLVVSHYRYGDSIYTLNSAPSSIRVS